MAFSPPEKCALRIPAMVFFYVHMQRKSLASFQMQGFIRLIRPRASGGGFCLVALAPAGKAENAQTRREQRQRARQRSRCDHLQGEVRPGNGVPARVAEHDTHDVEAAWSD